MTDATAVHRALADPRRAELVAALEEAVERARRQRARAARRAPREHGALAPRDPRGRRHRRLASRAPQDSGPPAACLGARAPPRARPCRRAPSPRTGARLARRGPPRRGGGRRGGRSRLGRACRTTVRIAADGRGRSRRGARPRPRRARLRAARGRPGRDDAALPVRRPGPGEPGRGVRAFTVGWSRGSWRGFLDAHGAGPPGLSAAGRVRAPPPQARPGRPTEGRDAPAERHASRLRPPMPSFDATQRIASAPTMAAAQVEKSKNCRSGRRGRRARRRARRAARRRSRAGWSGSVPGARRRGRCAFATIPASRPSTIQPMMPITSPSFAGFRPAARRSRSSAGRRAPRARRARRGTADDPGAETSFRR